MKEKIHLTRRELLKLSGLLFGAVLLPGCGKENDSLVVDNFSTVVPTKIRQITSTPTQTEIPTKEATSTTTPTETPVPIYSAEALKRLVSAREAEFLVNNRIKTGDPSRPNVLITYDDGDSNDEIKQIIDAYDRHGVKCTFFFTGVCLSRCAESINEAIKSGHEIGCHAYYHEDPLTLMSVSKVEEQLVDWMNEFSLIAPGYRARMWRAPFGVWNSRILEIAAKYGMQHVAWNVESGGVQSETFDIVFKNHDIVSGRYGTKNGMIVLSHAQRYYDIKESGRIVEEFLNRGLTPVTVSEGMRPENKWDGDFS